MIQFSDGAVDSIRRGKAGFFTARRSPVVYFSGFTVGRFASHWGNCPGKQAGVIKHGLQGNTLLGSKPLNSFANFYLLAETKRIVDSDLSSRNSTNLGHFKSEQYSEVLGAYLNSRLKNAGVFGSLITSALKRLVELGIHEFGWCLHTDAIKFGLNHDPFVGSSLIKFYTKCDHIVDAAKVFDEITEPDLVAYTSIVTAYAQVGDRQNQTHNAFGAARDMQKDGFEPNRVTLVSLLQCASRSGAVNEGKCIHGFAFRRKIGLGDEVFETSLINMYMKCGYPEDGAMIFNKMSKKSPGLYNAMITCHLQTGQPLEAFELFCRMVQKYNLDSIAIANGLLSCADLGYSLVGKSIHCRILRKALHLDLVCTTALINMYSKCKYSSSAMNVFKETDTKDDTLFHVMIAGYIRNGSVSRAIETFREMVNEHVRPNTGTVICILSSLSSCNESLRACKSIHGYVFRHDFETNTDIGNQFISAYTKFSFMGYARRVFDKMKLKDRVSWTSMMTGLVSRGHADEAIPMFLSMQRENMQPDHITFTILLQALNQLGLLALIEEVHGHIYKLFLEKDPILMSSLVTIYSKWGKFERALDVFERMERRQLSTWNTMISAYGMHGNIDRALELLTRMKRSDLAPDVVTFKSTLSACSHAGFVEEGLRVFRSMEKEYGVVPSDEHYGCVVDLLGRAGRLEEAYDILERAPLRRNASTVGALLAACRVHEDIKTGERVGRWLLDVGSENTSAYCSVSNMYAGGGRWDEVAQIGNVAKAKGIKRIPGFSRVDLYKHACTRIC